MVENLMTKKIKNFTSLFETLLGYVMSIHFGKIETF